MGTTYWLHPSAQLPVAPRALVVGTLGRVFVARHCTDVTPAAMDDVYDALLAARRHAGGPLIAVSIVPESVAPPAIRHSRDAEARFEVVRRLCSALYVVLEGDGTLRWIARGALQLRSLTMPIDVRAFREGAQAIEYAAGASGADPAAMVLEARERGLLV